jgi:hypothetical protein
MRKRASSIIITAILLLALKPAFGELLDRIVVIIDNSFIITLGDIRQERAIQSAFGSNPGDDDAIADLLVERHLVEEQIAQFRDIEVPEGAVTERLRGISQQPGVSEGDLRETVVREIRRYQFMVERFRQFIRVSDEELLQYYNEIYAPELRRRGQAVPPPEQGMEDVRQNVIALKMNQEVDTWLADLRRRSTVEKISK